MGGKIDSALPVETEITLRGKSIFENQIARKQSKTQANVELD